MEKWLSMKELVRLSNLPETTIRRYMNLFHQFVDTKEFGKHKKYSSSVPELMVRIAELYNHNKNTMEVHEILAKERGHIVIVPTEGVDTSSQFPVTPVEVLLQQNQIVVDSLQELIGTQRNEIELLKKGMEHLQKELEELKTTNQPPNKKKWFRLWL
jgi:DNA-binding transcriptional MerR regulator